MYEMLQIASTPQGTLIEDRFLFAPEVVDAGKINLMSLMGAEMAYDRSNLATLDFPGEYDIGGLLINVFVGMGNKLNFLVHRGEGKSFWVIQSPEVLEIDEVSGMDYWIFSDEAVEKKLDQLEMEGERIKIGD